MMTTAPLDHSFHAVSLHRSIPPAIRAARRARARAWNKTECLLESITNRSRKKSRANAPGGGVVFVDDRRVIEKANRFWAIVSPVEISGPLY